MTQNAINNTGSILSIDNLTLDGNTLSSTDTNGDILLAPDGSGTVSVTSAPIVPSGDRSESLGSGTNAWDNVFADGVTFDGGTNILNIYTESVGFTPTLAFGGGDTGITYSTNAGSATRIGNLVWISFNILLTSKGSDSGAATIEGLPFTAAVDALITARWAAINLSVNNTVLIVGISNGTTTIGLQQTGDNVAFTNITDTEVANDSQFFCSGVYRAS